MVDPGDSQDAAALDAAADQLYLSPADRFTAARTELAAKAKSDGQTALAKRIGALRKPTVAAALVNRMVLDDTGSVDRLADLYERLRQAHEDLDAGTLRELSAERRAAVSELAAAALALDERPDPPGALRDEVVATLDAAVADPEVLARLGRLIKAEHWSGFGVAVPTGSPELTLVHGGKDRAARRPQPGRGATRPVTEPSTDAPADDRVPSATARRLTRARDKARSAFDTADGNLSTAERTEQAESDRVKTLTSELADLQHELEQSKRDLDKARREVKSARTKRREAQSTLDRAERQAPH